MQSHYFIAIHLPEEVQSYFYEKQQELKRELPYKQWPHKKDLHITLKFLGPMTDGKLNQLQRILLDIKHCEAFSLETGPLGTFGNPNKPRVLWAGVNKPEALKNLQAKVEACCAEAGFEKEKRAYRPHITLAKKWDGEKINNRQQITGSKTMKRHIFAVKEIVLFRIHPSETPKYEAVFTFPLKGGGNTGAAD